MRTDCEACQGPACGLYVVGCRGCALRSIARSPEFFASQQAKVITPAYAARLQVLGEVAAVHKEVKAVAESLKAGVLL